MQLIGTTLISKWWIKRRGLMQGISGIGLSLAMTGIFTTLARYECASIGWRNTFGLIGLLLLVIFVPVCALFYLETPEAYGLKADNERTAPLRVATVDVEKPSSGKAGQLAPSPSPSPSPSAEAGLEGASLGEAMRTLDFYAVIIGGFSWAFTATGMFFHIVPLVKRDLGIGKGESKPLPTCALSPYHPTTLPYQRTNRPPHRLRLCAISAR